MLTIAAWSRGLLVVAATGIAAPDAMAADFMLADGVQATFGGALSLGTTLRTESPAPENYGPTAASRIGAPAGQLSGNADSADLNFKRGDAVSTALLGHFDLALKHGDFGVMLRTVAWYDYALKHGARPYGNVVNGFARAAPLSDAGFEPEARFANIRATEAYVHGRFNVAEDAVLEASLGRQMLKWGVAQFFGNGINIMNAGNASGLARAGARPGDGKLPLGMVIADLSLGQRWGVAAVLPYESHPFSFAGCGTFTVMTGGYATGCNFIALINSIDEASALTSGKYLHRRPDHLAPDSGQFGVSLRYHAADIDTHVAAYALNYHNRIPLLRIHVADIAGGYGTLAPDFTRLSDPQGLQYALLYPANIRLFGVSFDTRLDPSLRVYGELGYRPNQPVEYNTADVAVAFLTRSQASALNLALGVNALPPGASFDDYARFKTTTAMLGINKAFVDVVGAQRLVVAGEIGWNHVAELPDPGVLRFGRSESYGVAALDGRPCVDTSPAQKACAHEGFVTSNAWGYRLRLAAMYPAAAGGATLLPSLLFAHDVRGSSDDNLTFLVGRRLLRPALRAEWKAGYFAEINYARLFGGAYNLRTDRDTVSLIGGVNF